jgi:hypothetical protein
MERKYISFWEYPETYEKLLEIIKDIEISYEMIFNEKLNILKNKKEWIIENYENHKNKIIPLIDFKGDATKYSEKELKIPHLMTPIEKEKYYKTHNKVKGFGSEKSAKIKPIEWRNALGRWRGESKIQKYNNFKMIN